jgi:hypothetical protein
MELGALREAICERKSADCGVHLYDDRSVN